MKTIFSVVLLLLSVSTLASINDSDLSPGLINKNLKSQDYFRADSVERAILRRNTISVRAVLVKNGKEQLIEGVKFDLTMGSRQRISSTLNEEFIWEACEAQSSFQGRAKLSLEKFRIQNRKGREYELLFDGTCGESLTLKFNFDSLGGEFFGIWNISNKITKKFNEEGLGDFLTSKVRISFPANGDYYNGVVNVTKGYQWDVVGHEIGHAIYSRARIGRSAGGSHRIDECYSSALALSEGWASFFSAWVSVDLDDEDAKFEYMVPRRAPLEIEHVPADVCIGPKNEWRVYSFLWDLVDLNNDNENINIGFRELWDISAGVMHRDINSFKDALLNKGLDPVIVNIVWDQNILNR
ncbi:hypothetical protein [Halobacteriovorax sp. HLS]|uniref:hypothetical protein n=1 Tax=Halobacteriovorax sp. HLS TaxID=2234000 RepID=UPI000FD6E972|nr:hypothetical protein [Halobacteriovorax sp. HLS]